MFKFLSKGSKHRRTPFTDQDTISTEKRRNSRREKEEPPMPVGGPEAITATNYSEDQTEFGPEHTTMEPDGSARSSRSITAKPTTATLAESFSSGGVNEFIDGVFSGDAGVAEGDPYDNEHYEDGNNYYPGEMGVFDYQQDESDHGYTEFNNATQEEDDVDTLDYTATVNEPSEIFDHAARHERSADFHSQEEALTTWEETSLGYETCSRTLNTNLEGMNYVPDSSVMLEYEPVYEPSAHTHISANTGFSHGAGYVENEPQYYYAEEGYDQFQESYGAEEYYDANGNLVTQYPEQGHLYVDTAADNHTIANSTIATEGVETAFQSVITGDFTNRTGDDESAPIDTYESEDSGSSWGDEETRDMSLLDGSQDEEGDTFDENDDEDSDDDSESRHRRGGPKSVLQLLKQMKHCSLKGSSVSYDEDDDIRYVPDVAQISTGATSMTSMTDSFESQRNSNHRRKQKPRRRQKNERNLDNLFNKVSALGQELLGSQETYKKKGGKKSLRRRDRDPATKIVDSLRDIFNCGHPKHY